MAIENGYCTLEELRARVGAIVGDGDKNDILNDVIEAASRAIDNYTHRKFYKDSATATKYYTAEYTDTLFVNDDIVSVGTLSTDDGGDGTFENTWTENTDFFLLPYNDDVKTYIEIADNGSYSFPLVRRGVKVEGIFGIDGVPHEVREACLLLAHRYFKRKDTPMGIAGVTDLGVLQVLPTDVDVMQLLQKWRKMI